MSGQGKDFYAVLGVSEDASTDEIRKAYRKLAKQYHPDANAGDPQAAERFKEVSEAHAVLSSEEKRRKYDEMRKFGAFDPRARGSAGGTPGGGFPFEGAQGFSFEDLGGLGDIFSSIFDRGARTRERGRTRGPRRGPDLEYVVDVSFETAVRGGKVSVTVPVTEECATCSGSGAAPGARLTTCGECSGSGSVSFGQGGFAVTRPCPACLGRGMVPESPCASCAGTGAVRQVRKLQVNVPEGVETGTRLRLAGQGERGAAGGEPGDLILVFQVRPHRFFRREGQDIHVTVPINLAQATLGSKVRVRTVGGAHAVLTIPPGTQPGTRFRLRGHGVASKGRKGDQYVEVRLEVPRELPDGATDRFRAFAEEAGLRY